MFMARTKGASSQGNRRERFITFVRRGGSDDVVLDVGEVGTFLGRPIDGYLLLSYRHHVAYNIWQGEVSI